MHEAIKFIIKIQWDPAVKSIPSKDAAVKSRYAVSQNRIKALYL